jgi:Ca2+-binding RTX toxin-like protein
MGGIGDDTLYGGNGDDVLRGGIGLDDIFSGTGQDTFVVAAGESALLGEVDRFADYDFRYDYLDGPVPVSGDGVHGYVD